MYPEQHLGHHIGPAPTNEQLGITVAAEKPKERLLRDYLYPDGMEWQPIIVSCAACDITMWSTSDNALLDNEDRINCRSCLSA